MNKTKQIMSARGYFVPEDIDVIIKFDEKIINLLSADEPTNQNSITSAGQ